MPQMSPMNWFFLMWFNLFCFYYLMMCIYFMIIYNDIFLKDFSENFNLFTFKLIW